ncbi:hypothetical protein [Leucobacter chinensis]|uniref:hypothetical protein n=1 Tax=Leucobacter chinensis TaxID=2851010 RepID=UPI001C22D301|nr:hypothetical protein [Leucobacter chinensis]
MTNTITLHYPQQLAATLPQTPYRALSALGASDEPQTLIPSWASKRSVFRAGHATYYVVETERVSDARADLQSLESLGWVIDIHPLNLTGAARISMHMPEARTAA